jgi:hypothetical protein
MQQPTDLTSTMQFVGRCQKSNRSREADVAKRIQLSRSKGWRLPADAIKVDRSTRFGNPFRADNPSAVAWKAYGAGARTAADAFRLWMQPHPALADFRPEQRAEIVSALPDLRGRDLACWCKPGADCHADVLLELANKT